MKKLCLCLGTLAFALIVGSTLSNVNAQSKDELSIENPGSGSYLGPVCMNSSGTYYCCKNSSGSCDKPDTCPSCQ
jgi:hypothetical protein